MRKQGDVLFRFRFSRRRRQVERGGAVRRRRRFRLRVAQLEDCWFEQDPLQARGLRESQYRVRGTVGRKTRLRYAAAEGQHWLSGRQRLRGPMLFEEVPKRACGDILVSLSFFLYAYLYGDFGLGKSVGQRYFVHSLVLLMRNCQINLCDLRTVTVF